MNNYKKSNNGFTLIELMVTIAIVGIFASIAIPSFSSMIKSNRISTATNELVSNMLLAKSEALKRSQSVTLCPSTNQTSCVDSNDYSQGWIVFLDCNANNVVNDVVANCGVNGQEEIIKVHDGFDSVHMNNGVSTEITFNYTGRPSGVSTFDIGESSTVLTKEVVLNLVGRVRAQDTE